MKLQLYNNDADVRVIKLTPWDVKDEHGYRIEIHGGSDIQYVVLIYVDSENQPRILHYKNGCTEFEEPIR